MASSSSSSRSTLGSSYSSQKWKYDVFLSFRGEDTRKTFVDHLYTALDQQGIYTYKDDEKLPRGESIGPSLFKAIEESQIAIVVFSKNYANSSWCLDELAHVLKCREERGLIVMPIFYDVEPSQVRKQKGKFGKIFSKYKLGKTKKEEFWRKSLVDASNISGWEPKHIANSHESKCIKEILDTISLRVHPRISGIDNNLIGIEAFVKDLKLKLQMESSVVLMIGIWGLGGGGKTTLASTIYSLISRKFQGCCFVENVREDSRKYSLKKLQKKILYGVLKENNVKVNGVEEGRQMIMSRLCHRKVLIVLDDVDDIKQLEALAGSHDWFGEGSRIIITTRDVHVLNAHKVNVVHNISLLNDEDGMKLFCKHALLDSQRFKDYMLLSKAIVSYAGGLPLALKVIGSFLCDKDIDEWKSALYRLKKIPHTNILEILKISYDGLGPIEKELFLDIVCFFRGHMKYETMDVLDACGFYPDIGVKVLVQKSLITISEDGEFDMHDLIQEMGYYIVRGEHNNNPTKHSRVWKVEDVVTICAMDATMVLDNIKAISFESPKGNKLPCDYNHVVTNMKNLRMVSWKERSKSPLPANFSPVELCCLNLMKGLQRHLWEGYKYLPNLRMIKLVDMRNLIETPDFGGLPNLESLKLFHCLELQEIHPSIGGLEKLLYLEVIGCINLKKFPPITGSHRLKTYEIKNCYDVLEDLEIEGNMLSIENAELDRKGKEDKSCDDSEEELDTNVECFSPKETCIPRNIFNLIGLDAFHTSLTNLTFQALGLRDRDIDSVAWDFPSLKELHLRRNNFSRLDFSRLRLPRLKYLEVSHCYRLVEFSRLPTSIAILIANNCYSLKSVGDISNCKWLWTVLLLSFDGNIEQHTMLQGNAIEHHFVNFSTGSIDHIPRGLVDRFGKGKTFRMKLPDNWYSHFSGFLICFANEKFDHNITRVRISITNEVDKEEPHVWMKFHEAISIYQHTRITSAHLGYVSFNSLKTDDTTCLNPAFTTISISLKESRWLVAELVPRIRNSNCDHAMQITPDSSEFYDKEDEYGRKTFEIQHHSTSSVHILWSPFILTKLY